MLVERFMVSECKGCRTMEKQSMCQIYFLHSFYLLCVLNSRGPERMDRAASKICESPKSAWAYIGTALQFSASCIAIWDCREAFWDFPERSIRCSPSSLHNARSVSAWFVAVLYKAHTTFCRNSAVCTNLTMGTKQMLLLSMASEAGEKRTQQTLLMRSGIYYLKEWETVQNIPSSVSASFEVQIK